MTEKETDEMVVVWGIARRLDMLISATFDSEWALGGPQVQLSQAERHHTEERNLSLQEEEEEDREREREGTN